MRRPEGRLTPELADRTLPGGRRDDRRGESAAASSSGGSRARDRPRKQRLARTGRPDEQQPVAAGQRDLEAAPRFDLAADLGQIRGRRHGASPARPVTPHRQRLVSVGRRPPIAARPARRGPARRAACASVAAWTSVDRVARASRRPRPSIPSTSRASSTASAATSDPAACRAAPGRRPSAGRPARTGPRRRATARR